VARRRRVGGSGTGEAVPQISVTGLVTADQPRRPQYLASRVTVIRRGILARVTGPTQVDGPLCCAIIDRRAIPRAS